MNMPVNEITAKSILRRHGRVDSWFLSGAGMNLYRGCAHACVYCDGRAEDYFVEGEFGTDVAVKVNAIEILRRELDPARRRKPFNPGYVLLGGGVGDSYQPADAHYKLARQALELLHEFGYAVHILTKSVLVERDLDLIKAIGGRSKTVVSFSFSSMDPDLCRVFEPGVPPPAERLACITRFRAAGIPCGMFLMPVIPFLTDTPAMIDQSIRLAKAAGAEFVIFGGMTLKPGRQEDHFMAVLKERFPDKLNDYVAIYPKDREWGRPTDDYQTMVHEVFATVARKHHLPVRIPPRLFPPMELNDRVTVILDQIGYLYELKGVRRTPYGFAAHSISKLKAPLDPKHLRDIPGVGPEVERVVREIMETGTAPRYEELMGP
jgi:DNA repair photolyase